MENSKWKKAHDEAMQTVLAFEEVGKWVFGHCEKRGEEYEQSNN